MKMQLIEKIISKRLIKEIVSKIGNRHFRRWSIVSTPLFNIYVHCIERSDEDPDPHDHPWNFISVILKGAYLESVKTLHGDCNIFLRKRGNIFFHSLNRAHKITILNGPVWTLVFTGKRKEDEWGYHTEYGWVDNKSYRLEKYKNIIWN